MFILIESFSVFIGFTWCYFYTQFFPVLAILVLARLHSTSLKTIPCIDCYNKPTAAHYMKMKMQNHYMKIIIHLFDHRKIDAPTESKIFKIPVIPLLFLNVLVFSMLIWILHLQQRYRAAQGAVIVIVDLVRFEFYLILSTDLEKIIVTRILNASSSVRMF